MPLRLHQTLARKICQREISGNRLFGARAIEGGNQVRLRDHADHAVLRIEHRQMVKAGIGKQRHLAESQELVRRYAAKAEQGSLAADPRVAEDLGSLEDGVAAVWVDNAAVAEEAGVLDPMGFWLGGLASGRDGLSTSAGRTTMGARFAGPDVFEVVGSVGGAEAASWATHSLTGLEELPARDRKSVV